MYTDSNIILYTHWQLIVHCLAATV